MPDKGFFQVCSGMVSSILQCAGEQGLKQIKLIQAKGAMSSEL